MTAPTTTTPAISSSEPAPFRIAAAFMLFAASVIADLTTLFNASAPESGAFEARAVITSLPACTYAAGVLTATANGALPTQDGITTLAVGDRVLIQAGTTNLPSAAASGLYQVTSLGGSGSKVVLTLAPEWAYGSTVPLSQRIEVGGEGSFYANSSWKATCAKGTVVGTTDPALYVGNISFPGTLIAGVLSLPAGTLKVGVLSSSRTFVSAVCATTGGTVTTTVQYSLKAAPTPGYVGTSAFTVYALSSAQVTQTGDISTVTVNVDNGF